MAELSDKEELLCQEYLVDLIQTKAYMRAFGQENYNSARTESSKHFALPNVQARIKELMNERVERTQVTQDWVILRLKEISDKAMTAEPVLTWDYELKELVPTGEYTFDSTGANKATELIGKHLGMFKERIEHSGEIAIPTETLEAIASRLNANAK